jgi:hypothetical protein
MGQQMGQGAGGLAPEQQTGVGFQREKTPVYTTKGKIIGQFLIKGSQFKRESVAELQDVFISAEKEATEAIARDKVPPYARDAVRQYFARGSAQIDKQVEQQDKPDR